MATDFTNKYIQVFQTYDEFGEHSADYVKGEDHIAYLIQENEVIYWLYLEQVWRPLNVRTTTTGELEDGRTKVAVRLEYVEGSQKYTSVPNIPDPERITSMSHFLEDYPDIEEVNVSGTVNLTDLSYAFANSNIKDFSLLDTSNVTKWRYFIYNLDDKTLEFNIKCDVPEFDSFNSPDLYNVKIKGITFTTPNLTNDDCVLIGEDSDIDYVKGIGIGVNAAEGIVETIYSDVSSEIGLYAYRQKLTNVNTINCDNTIINIGRVSDVTHNGKSLILNLLEKQDEYDFNVELNHKITTNANNIIFTQGDITYDIPFGYGIKYNENADIVINTDVTIGNFYLVTPIVDDAFYAKYNHPISIFQYKTTFEEVADVNLTESTNTSLMYIDWGSIDFDTSGTNVEIYNNVDISGLSGTFNKIIIDNSSLTLNYDEYPSVDDSIKNLKANDGYISGNYVHNRNSSYYIYLKNAILYKDVILWNVDTLMISNCSTTILKDKNIRLRYTDENNVPTIMLTNGDLDINVLAIDNVIPFTFYISRVTSKLIFDNNVTLDITGDSSYGFYINNIIEYLTSENQHTISGNVLIDDSNDYCNASDIIKTDSVYLNGKNQLYILNWYSNALSTLGDYDYIVVHPITNIYGTNIGIRLPNYDSKRTKFYMDGETYKHIDISNVMIRYSSEGHMLCFINSDEETTINLITKLIDNTDSSSKTIYMYRSQADVIGEENIAGAVAKNYEFAIIEN